MDDTEIPSSNMLLYPTEDGKYRIQVRLSDGDLWLTQGEMAALFETTSQNINAHLADIYREGEVQQDATTRTLRVERLEGTRTVARSLQHHSLRATIAVGFRVRSTRGMRFRQWAIERLDAYLVKGFAMDDERLKSPPGAGHVDYFDELLQRIRDIRTSERRFYQKVLDIYATSTDYDANTEHAQRFFATVQNKLHWATHGHTAAEIINERANAQLPLMGLTTTQTAGVVRKADVIVAKNYLSKDELQVLQRLVTIYIDFAELQAMQRRPMAMRDWLAKVDEFLRLTGRELLDHVGSISKASADAKAEGELERYRHLQDALPRAVDADFDKATHQLKRPEPPKAGKRTPRTGP